MNYFSEPPALPYKTSDVPTFIKKWYNPSIPCFSTEYILKLIRWAELELEDTISFYKAVGDMNKVAFIRERLSSDNVVAHSKEFALFVKYIDGDTWNSIPRSVRDTLYNIKQIYDKNVLK